MTIWIFPVNRTTRFIYVRGRSLLTLAYSSYATIASDDQKDDEQGFFFFEIESKQKDLIENNCEKNRAHFTIKK